MARTSVERIAMLTAVTTVSSANSVAGEADEKTYSAWGETSSGAGAATIVIEGTMNGGSSYETIGTISLTLGTTTTSDGFTSSDRYEAVRARVSAISGTGASVNAAMGC